MSYDHAPRWPNLDEDACTVCWYARGITYVMWDRRVSAGEHMIDWHEFGSHATTCRKSMYVIMLGPFITNTTRDDDE